MSSSISHRRRSHSASNPSSPGHRRKLHDNSWRGANKRTLSRNSPDSSSPRKQGPDNWRIKRRRRDSSPGSDTLEDNIFRRVHHTSSQMNSAFACTAADFQLFPNRARPRRRSPRSTSPPTEEPMKDLNSLRSDAFQELHRSVEDSGAGFVDSMREYERSRPRFASPNIGRRQSMSTPPSSHGDAQCDMEDIQTSKDTGAYPFTFYALLGGSSSSFGTGTSGTTASDSEMCSSPSFPSSASSLILCDDEDDEEDEDVAIATGYASEAAADPHSCGFDAPSSEAHQSTRSEKALAALTLAMANGAGSIQDYSAVQMHDSTFEDDSRMGELWH